MVSSSEEIEFGNGWIGADELLELVQPLAKTAYGRYLQSFVR
jgi:glucose-1-phosphate thymidylyltransferase